MKRVFILGIAISLFMTSCVKYSTKDEVVTPKTTDVTLSIETGTLVSNSSINKVSAKTSRVSKSGEYKRYSAPVYVSGVSITAKSLDFTGLDNVVTDFSFVDGNSGGKDITMTVPFGDNNFSATSLTNVVAENEAYPNSVNKFIGSGSKLDYYSAELIKAQKIYAIFNGSQDYTVTENNPSFNIPMTTESARYGVVLETSVNYDVKMTATLGSAQKVITKATSANASAIIFNDKNVTNAQELVVELEVSIEGVVVKTKTLNGYTAEAGKNKTLVISYNKSGEILTEETGITFTWTPMKDEGEIKDID